MTDYVENCNRVTRADIQQYVKRYIVGKPYIAGLIINPEMNKATHASETFKPNL
jgi:zinc protease